MNLRPKDLWTWKYWAHLGVIAVIVLGILQVWKGNGMLTLTYWWQSALLIGVADITAHTVLGFD